MGRFLNLIALSIRNGRAMGYGLAIWVAVAVMWGLKCRNDRDPLQEVVRERGTLVRYLNEANPHGDRDGLTMRQAVIKLADGTSIELLIMPPWPPAGAGVPLRVELYRSGKRSYSFDRQEWLISGSG